MDVASNQACSPDLVLPEPEPAVTSHRYNHSHRHSPSFKRCHPASTSATTHVHLTAASQHRGPSIWSSAAPKTHHDTMASRLQLVQQLIVMLSVVMLSPAGRWRLPRPCHGSPAGHTVFQITSSRASSSCASAAEHQRRPVSPHNECECQVVRLCDGHASALRQTNSLPQTPHRTRRRAARARPRRRRPAAGTAAAARAHGSRPH